MFEKEAEEYAVLNARQYIHNEDIGFCTSEEEVRQAYQKGAEFGYNKANEWHYVKDGDLPPCEKGNCTINVLTDCGDIAYYNYDEECWISEPASVEIDPPVAWGELPKFKK